MQPLSARNLIVTLTAVIFASGASQTMAEDSPLTVWAVDPLVKVFRDAKPAGEAQALAEVARGEHATFQVVVRCPLPVKSLRVETDPFALETDRTVVLTGPRIRFVGYVPVDRPTQKPAGDQHRKPPADYPDPLLEDETIDIQPDQAQPVWITIAVSTNARPGLYRSTARLSAKAADRTVTARIPLALKVCDVEVGRSRLWVTNWFAMQWQHMSIAPKPESPEYYALLRRYARNMAEHRQNVVLISPLSLADFKVGANGQLELDFSRFDQWVTIFIEEGVIGRIEGGHLGGRSGEWESPFVVSIREVNDGNVIGRSVDPAGPEADRFHSWFLPTLVSHLKEKGWLKQYCQHLADEPIEKNVASYRAIAALVRKYAPELRIIEACHTKDLTGAIDIWVPQLNYLHRDFQHYQERRRAGDEVWFYTCVFPQGEYANRFIEQPLLKTRLLHWINYRYGITGYLHWGYNHWRSESPFGHTTPSHPGPPYLPAGDAWIVYPGRQGPLDSIRHEAMRDGIADYELLAMLGERNREAAQRLAAALILDFDKYNCDVPAFRTARRELLELLARR